MACVGIILRLGAKFVSSLVFSGEVKSVM